MAQVTLFRLLIALGAAGVRVVKWAEGPGPASLDGYVERFRDRFGDPQESDSALEGLLSAAGASLPSVATYSDPFELRRVQLQFSHNSNDAAGEDVRVITFHLAKIASGAPTGAWVAGDFTAANARFNTWWNAFKANYTTQVRFLQIKYYKAGPQIEPPQLPVHTLDQDNPGTATTGTLQLPPQVSLTVTEKTGLKKNWGRFYLPPMATTVCSVYGRPTTAFTTAVADATDVMYEGLKADGLHPVIYLPAMPERSPSASDPRYQTKGTFPPRAATARSVDELQVDDVFDVLRSRRFTRATLRTQRAIA